MSFVDVIKQKSKEESNIGSNEEYVELLSRLADSFGEDAQTHRDLFIDPDVQDRAQAAVIHHVSTGNSALTAILARLLQNQIALEKKIDKLQGMVAASLKVPAVG